MPVVKFRILLALGILVTACDAPVPTGPPPSPITASPRGTPSAATLPAPPAPLTTVTTAVTPAAVDLTAPLASPPPTSRGSAGAILPVTTHPRLWVRAADVPTLRGWATDSNPLWKDGLERVATAAQAAMDAGTVPRQDGGTREYEEYATEMYAELFAFLSVVSPDEAARANYAQRARTLLLGALTAAVQGPAENQPFRGPEFYTGDSNRARWHGEGWALTVDWIYPSLSATDKATIRTVFLRWAEEIVQAGYHHPEPVGMVNDPQLLANAAQVRWAGNNHYSANMRNLGLLALALDPADDPGGTLGGYLRPATGADLYLVDHLYRTGARGGLAPEGFEYSPQATGYVAQLLLALHTAGQDDPARWGPQVRLADNPFWADVLPAFFHTMSPAPAPHPDLGPVYQPAWYGDGQRFWTPEYIELFGPLGLYDRMTGNTAHLDALRWAAVNMMPGGTAGLAERVGKAENFRDSILYFLLLEPKPLGPDPRPALPHTFFAPGLGQFYARTGWDAAATWVGFTLGWNTVDHQHGDGGNFHFYRQGEWLTKETTGYDTSTSDYHNTLALQNDPPEHNDPGDYRHEAAVRGSQWIYNPSSDGKILAQSVGPDFVYMLGDMTGLYNSEYEGVRDILHASRVFVWLQPDMLVLYDRATSKTGNRFKRFWLQLPGPPTISGNRVRSLTPKGQQVIVTVLAPVNALLTTTAVQAPENGEIAAEEPMKFRLQIAAPGNPQDTRFLTVLQGADAGAAPPVAEAIQSTAGTPFAGVTLGSQAVLFPVAPDGAFAGLTVAVPTIVKTILVTGLQPNSGYTVSTTSSSEGVQLQVAASGTSQADTGGVLRITRP